MLTEVATEAAPDPRTDLRERRLATVVFIASVLLMAGVKWFKGWPLGAMIVVVVGIFYFLIPTHRRLTVRMGLTLAWLLLAIALEVVAGDANSPVASLGMTLVFLSLSGNLISPFLIRPARFEAT